MILIEIKNGKFITSQEHSDMKKRALSQGILNQENKKLAEEPIQEDSYKEYKSELFYLIQSPERLQMLDEGLKHDVNLVCQASEIVPSIH